MIAILTKDLMMSSSAGASARANRLELLTIPTVAKLESVLSGEHVIKLLMIDLQMPGLDLESLSSVIGSVGAEFRPTTIAYAQHVNVDLIQQAKTAAFDQVLTRGQFNSNLGTLIANHGS
jgi:hypothetical protein